jgi:peptidoglycan/LPS O-acetylase OafA/YrhL
LNRDPSIKNYSIKRFCRVYPLYFLVIVVQCFLLLMRLDFDLRHHLHDTVRYLACNLVFAGFLQDSIGGALPGLRSDAINGSLWTLKLEVIFYLFLPAFLLLHRRWGKGTLLVPYLLLSFLEYLVHARHGAVPSHLKDLFKFQFFFVGIGLYFYGRELLRYKSRFLPVGALLFLFLISVHYFKWEPVPVLWQIAHPLLIGLAVFCLAFADRKSHLRYDLSYGIYVIHYPLVQTALSYGLFAGHPYALFFVSLLAAVTLLAWLSYRYVESPFIRLARRYTRPAPGLRQW